MHFSHNASINREKIKFTLRTGYGQTNVYRPVLLSALNAVQMAMESGVVTDKGHSSKASGDSVIEFFIQQRLVRFNPSVEELVPAAASAMVSNIVEPTSPAYDVVLDSATPADSDEPTPVESALEEIRKALKENADRIQANIEEYRGIVQQLANLSEDELAQASGIHASVLNSLRKQAGEIEMFRESMDDGTYAELDMLIASSHSETLVAAFKENWAKIWLDLAQTVTNLTGTLGSFSSKAAEEPPSKAARH